ncbi:hypothetical protein J6590_024940 [Homalodisca vitripennis]|nr:hypothetical protein J6590_024940 [Homalodisca vitripennis]
MDSSLLEKADCAGTYEVQSKFETNVHVVRLIAKRIHSSVRRIERKPFIVTTWLVHYWKRLIALERMKFSPSLKLTFMSSRLIAKRRIHSSVRRIERKPFIVTKCIVYYWKRLIALERMKFSPSLKLTFMSSRLIAKRRIHLSFRRIERKPLIVTKLIVHYWKRLIALERMKFSPSLKLTFMSSDL